MDRSEATSSVESASVIGSKEIKSCRRIKSVTDFQQRPSNAVPSEPNIYRHIGNIHGNRSISESAHKADNHFSFNSN